MKKYFIIIIAILFIIASCNNDFLEKSPKTLLRSSYNPYAFQTIQNVSSGNGWNFDDIRRINIMIANIDESSLNIAEKNHWRAIGYFFHSFWYMELVNRFGDVPWITEVLDETSEGAYGPRDDRKIVADSILFRLKWAEEHIGQFENRDGKNMINKDVIQATLSRFTLREGSWRKYHELGDYEKYFKECARVSEILMDKYPILYKGTDGQPAAGYGEMWTSEDLSNIPGVIFYKEFKESVLTHRLCHGDHTATNTNEMPQHTVDMYLCKDGKTISNSPLYAGDKDIFSTFRNRDPRMYHTIMPPYRVKPKAGDYPTWSFTDDPSDREYMDILGLNESCSNPGIGMKRLPAQNWGASLVSYIPNLQNGIAAQGTKSASFVACRSGYYVWKHYNNWETNFNAGALNTSDKPIFKIEEVLLNYAECKWEQNEFNQSIADITINKLRNRADMASMTVSEIDNNFDPKRDFSVDPILWEIRRERMIELMGEGFGFDDVRRWKKADWYVNRQALGMWIEQSKVTEYLWDATTHLPTKSQQAGYIYLWADPLIEGKGWLDKYYLYQIPTNEIALDKELKQNPEY